MAGCDLGAQEVIEDSARGAATLCGAGHQSSWFFLAGLPLATQHTAPQWLDGDHATRER